MDFFMTWKKVLMEPKKAYAQMKGKPDLMVAAKHLVVAGVISGAIVAVIALLGGGALLGVGGAAIGGVIGLAAIITTPIALLIGWVIGSVILLIFAKLLGGKGSFAKHSYMIALYSAPLFVISTIVGIIPIAGGLLSALVGLYGLYLLTLAMMYAHGFDMVKAALVWIIPLAIVIVLAVVMGVALLGGIMAGALGKLY
jgi:hypothetical protein